MTFSGGNHTGWDIGAGLEYAITDNWTIRGEYRHYDFGSVSTLPDGVVLGLVHNQKDTLDTGRVGFAYKFGGPVVARY